MKANTESRTNKFVKNIVGSAILQIVTIITGFISPKLMLNAFGSEINGITSSIMQFLSYLALVEAGLSNATVFALYKPLAEKDNEARDSIVSASKLAYYRIGFLFVGLSLLLAIVYPFIGHTDVLNRFELGCLVLVLCSQSTINFFVLAKYRTLLTADQCGYAVSLASSVQLIVHLVIITFAVRAGLNVLLVRGLGICSLFVTSAILAIIVRVKYGKINYNAKPNMKALDKRWDALFLQVTGVVATSTPVVIMTALLDFRQISIYAIYNMIAGSVSTCISVFTSGLSASFGNIYALDDKELLKRTVRQFRTAFYVLMTVVYAVMMVTLIPFISIYTDGIHDVNYIVPLFGVMITLKGMIDNYKAPHGMLIYSFGKFNTIKRQTVTQTVLIVVATWIFTKRFGLVGSMAALCLANLYMLVELLILSPKELVEMSISQTIRQIAQSLVIVFALYFLSLKIGYRPAGYLEWFVCACGVGIIAVIVTVGVFFVTDHEDMIAIYKRVMVFLGRGKRK